MQLICKVTAKRLANGARKLFQGIRLRRDPSATRIIPRRDDYACFSILLDFDFCAHVFN